MLSRPTSRSAPGVESATEGTPALPPWDRGALRWLLVVAAAGFALRVAWAIYAAREPVGLIDPSLYSVHARAIADGEGYAWFFGEDTAYYPPGYPISLGVVLWFVRLLPLPDGLPGVAAAYNVVLGTATIVLVAELGRRMLRSTAAGVVAAAIVAVWPNLVVHSSLVLSETLFNALVVATLVVLAAPAPWQERHFRPARLVAAGVLLAAATYVRPISALLLLALLWALVRAGFGWRRSLVAVGVVTGTAVALILPWTIRNLIVLDSPVLLSTNFGDNLCIGHHPGATGHFELLESCLDGYDPDLSRAELEVERNSRETRRAVRFALRNPSEELELLPKRFWYTVNSDHDGVDASESYGADQWLPRDPKAGLKRLSDLWWCSVLAVSALSLLLLRRREGPIRLLVPTILALIAPPLIFFGDPRFHVPVVPFLAVLAALGLTTAARALVEARRPAAPRTAAPVPAG